MGWTLSRYFFVRYATITAWFFLGISALILLVDFTELAGRVAGLPGFTLPIALGISALRMPMIMLQTVPFVALFAAMATLVSLNRKYELVIARSAGISAWQFLLPVCIGALVFGILCSHACSTRLRPMAFRAPRSSRPICVRASPTRFRPSMRPGSGRKPARATRSSAPAPCSTRGSNWPMPYFSRSTRMAIIVERKDAKRAFLRTATGSLQERRCATRAASGLRRNQRCGWRPT